jgi:hypothetical protein
LQSNSYFAPLYGRYVNTKGKDAMGVPPSPEFQQLIDTYAEIVTIVDDEPRQLELTRSILRQWAEEAYILGICRQELITIVANRFKNVPDKIIHDWRVYTPAYIGIEQFYIDPAE